MYSVFVDGVRSHDNSSTRTDVKFISPKLSLKDSSAGSFEATIPPNNVCYETIQRMKSTVSVYRDGKEMWRGRVLKDVEDFYKRKKITCEGALAFLNDTQQSPREIEGTLYECVRDVLKVHNRKVDDERRINVGNISIGVNHVYLNLVDYSDTFTVIKSLFANFSAGHMNIRCEDEELYLDFLTSYNETTQTVSFRKNLLDLTRTYDMSDLVTVIIPLGDKLEDRDDYLTVSSVNSGSIYVQNTEALSTYGRIEKVVHFDGITDANDLIAAAQEYLSDYQFDNIVLDVSAVDLHYLDSDIDSFNLLDNIQCLSSPHGLNKKLPLTELNIPLDNPASTTITLGEETDNSTLSSKFENYTTSDDVSSTVKSTVKDEVKNSVSTEVSNQVTNIQQNIVNTQVIKSETMQATWCFSKYMLVQFLETNFEAIDVNKSYKSLRKYIRIYDDNIEVIEAEISDTETETYKDPNGQKLYWTSIDGSDAYKFFTYSGPMTTSKAKKPDDMTSSEFEETYEVKVRKTTAKYVKCTLGFPLNSSGTGEPELVLGTGDENNRGKLRIVKDTDAAWFEYTSRTDGTKYAIMVNDEGWSQVYGDSTTKLYPIAVVNDVAEADNLPVGTLVFVGNVGG
jgi:hypothetical protein